MPFRAAVEALIQASAVESMFRTVQDGIVLIARS